ncbi:MAG: ferrous iron transporter B, partial [Chlorobi bacterium]|nr:ferrous iron transporter B [Chlorobiota bacterium]
MNNSDPRPSAACHRPHKHFGTNKFPDDPNSPSLVLVGNPNVGKSVVFNYLGGVYVDVSNFPGTTVEISRARYKEFVMYDTPGIYGVSSFNDEERVARDIILNADVVLNVVDAMHLERDLFLTLQIIDMGKKVVVALNMMDEVRHHHMDIDVKELSALLGVPVVETVAVRKAGLDNLPAAIEQAREGNQDPRLHHRLHEMLHVTGSQGEALLLLEGDEVIAQRHGVEPMSSRDEIYVERRNRVNEIIARVVTDVSRPRRISTFVGRLAINTWVGIPLFLVILYLMYLFVGSFIAQDVVNYTEKEIGNRIVEFSIKKWVGRYAGFDLDVQVQNEEGDVIETRQYTFAEGIRG